MSDFFLYSKYELSITHLYLYKKNNNNQNISNTDLLNLTINIISIQKPSPINLTKNTSNLFTLF